ncbi:MAG: Ig-like domain-containing protein, partial [Peptococcaceae bacterium]|nr:Ig-like domain-containing protein [Peptococcaceae bacterium]
AGIIGSPAAQKPPEIGGTSEGQQPPANPAKDPINDFSVCPITVTADATSPFGIDDDATFLVRGEGLTEAGIYKTIAFSPDNNYRVEPQGDGSFRLEPERLVKNSIVTLSYSNDEGQMVKRWAFQVKNDFTILSTSPRDGTEYAPVTTGVEVRFSQKEIDLDSYKAAFSIQPAVNGTFQQFADTIVFIPDKLECNVTYQVTVAATAKNLAGETLPEAKVFSFSCVDDSRVFYNAESQFQTFLPDDVHLVQLSVSSKYSGQAVDVTLYRFPSAADYAGQMKACIDMPIKRNMKIDYTRLEKQFEASIPQMKVNDWGPSYVVFDEPLPMGRYLAECRMGRTDAKCYSFIQVTDTTVFSMGNGAEQLVWVNDASTGEPLAGAEVRFERAGSVILGTTNSEGYIVIDQAGLDPGDALLAVGNGEVAFHTVLNVRDGGNDSMGRYYSYLYTDREIYKPTDVIRVWGIVRPLRASGKPQKATVNVGGYSEPVFIGDDGSYLCEIPVTQLRSSYFDITLELDGERAFSKYIEISDYIKPIYIIDAATDKFLYTDIDSESVNVMIDASFYDGTPARDLPIRARTSSAFSITPAITLDKNGHGALVITNRMPERNWMPSYDFYYYGGDDIEDAYEMMDGMFYFAPRDIALLTEVSYDEGGRPAVAITTRSIDVSGINSYRELYAEGYPENILAGPADASGNLSVEYIYYTKKEQEPYYDFINKTTVRRYSYERHVEQWGSYAFATSGGAYIFDQLPALGMDPTRYSDHYWLTFTYQDARGRATLEHCYVNPGNDDVYQEKTDYKTYYFTDKYNSDIGGGYNSRYYDSFDYSYYWDSGFRYNSEHGVSLLLNENDSPVLMPEGARFLTGLTQEKLLQASVSYTDTIEIPFEEKLIPNAVIAGCYFDGKHVYPIRATSLRYDYNERKLNVDIRAEKDSYQPGETAAFTVTATDLRGAPMENATVSLSVVDEAIFTLAPQSVNILKTLYSPAFEPRVSLYASYTQYNLDLIQAECGEGGGGVAIREDFADTAAFLTAHTGSDGIARFTFKLPDNLTSWRITAQAVNAGLFAGDNTINITTNLPMF